jgi:hypothetical protein
VINRPGRLWYSSAVLCLLVLAAAPLGAQGTAIVPLGDHVYGELDRLSELGLLDSVIVGQRPYSRRELARIARVAQNRLASRDSSQRDVVARGLVERLSQRFERSTGDSADASPLFGLVDGASVAITSTDAVRRGFPLGDASQLEATIDPLAFRRLGLPAVQGQTLAVEVAQRVEPTEWLALQARERLEVRAPRDASLPHQSAELLLASARARWRNLAVTAGRAQFAWAQGEGDGLFLASDAPALDQISIAGDRPFILPGFLSRLGPTQATLMYAELGASVVRSQSKLLAYKVSVNPTASLELGGTFFNHFGGEGGAPSSFGNRLIDFLPFIDIFRKHNYYDSTKTRDVDSDKVLGVDGRWRVPHLGGVLLTGELLIDDFDVHRIPYLLTGYGSSMLGIVVPAIGSPDWSVKLSAKHMGIITYTHFVLTNGITTRGRLLGDELGPDAKAFGAEVRWQPDPSLRVAMEGRAALYSQALYGSTYTDVDSVHFVVYKISSGPNELRDRVRGTVELQRSRDVTFVLRAGAERTRNPFFAGTGGVHYALDVSARLDR